jgi:dTDP-4-dehydrorhamnose reductase
VTRALVTGAAGLLGGRLAALLAPAFEVVAGVHRTAAAAGTATIALDLTAPETVAGALERVRPEAVVHAAALADADRCEQEPDRAQEVNVRGTAVLAEECARRGTRLVVVSTDLVLDGERGLYGEGDPARPLMVYGRTKLEAEEEALRRCAGSSIVRVALVCGRGHGPRATASEGIAWAIRAGRGLRLFTDQYRTPVDPEAVAGALGALLSGTGEGRYHLGGSERVSRHELGLRVAAAFGLPTTGIEAVAQPGLVERGDAARRPRDVSLDSSRARRELGFSPRPLDAMIRSGRKEPPPV